MMGLRSNRHLANHASGKAVLANAKQELFLSGKVQVLLLLLGGQIPVCVKAVRVACREQKSAGSVRFG